MKAAFGFPEYLCPEDAAVFTDSSTGKIVSWNWNFGNGHTSAQQVPEPQRYPRPSIRTKLYTVQLIVENDKHCFDTAKHQVVVVNTCHIAVPTAFSPNGDYNNDYLYPLNAFKAKNLEFRVYNRYGQVVFYTNNWLKKWDGTLSGKPQPTGTYVWTLSYTHSDTGEKLFHRGTTVLVR
jgi:gliding motility-associated-like protein